MSELEQQFSDFIKIYIGQLPLDFEDNQLKFIIEPLAPIKQLKIIKGDNTRGRFDLFCYAFVTIYGNEAFAQDLIQQLHNKYPTWKMNIKHDDWRKKQDRGRPFQPPPFGYPPQQFQAPPRPPFFPSSQPPTQSAEQIVGQKPCNIMVRQLWLGGVPQGFDKNYLGSLMAYYGIIEDIQMFPKFAFVKYKQASQATTAFERAEEVFQRLGSPHGFRIFFSDPLRRAYVVSNHYQFQRQGPPLPYLFIGLPPITSATVEMEVIKPVVEKFAPVIGEYMRKSSNSQNRSYFIFTFQDSRVAVRVKQELSRRKDLIGDKRAEVAVLLDEAVIMKNRDLSHTVRMFQNDNQEKRRYFEQGKPPMMHQMGYPPPPMYHGRGYPMGYMPHPYYPPPPYYYEQPPYPYYKPEQAERSNNPPAPKQKEEDNNIHDLLKDVLASDKDSRNEKKPAKKQEEGREQDILSKLLGNDSKSVAVEKEDESARKGQKRQDREPSWSGFLTWNGQKRVGVDGHCNKAQIEDYSINIKNTIDAKDMVLKDKDVMVLQTSSSIGLQTFKQYVKGLESKVGVALTSQYLMYVMGKSKQADELAEIGEDELLVVIEKASTLSLIKDKLTRSEELS